MTTVSGTRPTDDASSNGTRCQTGPTMPATRFPGLIAAVAHWQLIQSTRIKVELPEKALIRQGGGAPTWLTGIREVLDAVEKDSEKAILRQWKTHPLRAWGLAQHGMGEHSLAVLVGLLDGDPYVAYPKKRVGAKGSSRFIEGDPYVRRLSELWSYCGVGDANRRRERGMSQEETLALGKPLAKSRLRLIAENMLKAGNREGYDSYKDRFTEREGWTDGRKHASSLRLVAKYDVLAPLYDESRRLHEAGEWMPAQ